MKSSEIMRKSNQSIDFYFNNLKDEEIMFLDAYNKTFNSDDYISFSLSLLKEIELPLWNMDLFEQCENLGKILGLTTMEYLNILSKDKNKDFVYRELLLGKNHTILLERMCFVHNQLLRVLKYNKKDLKDVNIKPEHLAELLSSIQFPKHL